MFYAYFMSLKLLISKSQALKDKKKILIIYEFFFPAYKAGGIIQSLKNLIYLMHPYFDFYIITGSKDLNESINLAGIPINSWNKVNISNDAIVNVWYDDKKNLNYFKLNTLFKQVSPDIFYINGFMSVPFLLLPLIAIKTTSFKYKKIIVAPRGMLQQGAVSVNYLKKKLFLLIIQVLGLTKNIQWHITADVELLGILKYFKFNRSHVNCISNIPVSPVKIIQPIAKQSGILNLVYASIITEKKNLRYLLETLQHCKSTIQLNIYGVIKEQSYWSICQNMISKLPKNIYVHYAGEYKPEQMQHIVSQSDAMVLLSKGENFSHAIYESLSAGRPVISSHYTSWNNLTSKYAGWNFAINEPKLLAMELDDLASYAENEWNKFAKGAYQLSNDYISNQTFVDDYLNLFYT